MTEWFARPVLHVSNVEASLRFYVDRLGFTVAWRYEEDGRARVAQVDRGSCVLIFSDQWREKVGKGLMFISLNVEPETHNAEVAALDALRAELEGRGVPVKDGVWGYRLLVVEISTATSFSLTIRTSRAGIPKGCVEHNERGMPSSWIGATFLVAPANAGPTRRRLGLRVVAVTSLCIRPSNRIRLAYNCLERLLG
jgi:catechol 2,3-dioxygenase-like lactoylglutathione lyase family enzyme